MGYVKFTDEDKNVYEITVNGKCYLTLSSDGTGKRKHIGQIVGDTLYKNEKNTIIFRKTREFGFPYELLKYLIETGRINRIEVEIGRRIYSLKIENPKEFFKNVNFRYYKRKGYERQVFIKISDFKQEVV